MIPLEIGDIAVVFKADGRIETDFDAYGGSDDDLTDEMVDDLHPMYRALLVAVLFLPFDPELSSIRDRIYEISKSGPLMSPPEGELN
jgi:hypothetical protein